MVDQTAQASTLERVREIIAEELDRSPEAVTPTARLGEDLGVDSLSQCEIAMALEEQCGIEIWDDDWDDALQGTVQSVADLVERLLGAGAQGEREAA